MHHIIFLQNIAQNFAGFFAMYIFSQIYAQKFAKTFAEILAIAKIPARMRKNGSGRQSRRPSAPAVQPNQTKNNDTPTIASLGYTGPSYIRLGANI